MRKSLFPKQTLLAASSSIDDKNVLQGSGNVKNSPNLLRNYFLQIALCKLPLAFCFFFYPLSINAQKPLTYYDDIEPIIQKNCVACHRQGQIAPFPLLTYEDVDRRAGFIKKVTAQKYMPPNPSDPSVSTFKNVKKLTPEEIEKIGKWVEQGKVKGKEQKTKGKGEESMTHLDTTWREPDIVLSFTKPIESLLVKKAI